MSESNSSNNNEEDKVKVDLPKKKQGFSFFTKVFKASFLEYEKVVPKFALKVTISVFTTHVFVLAIFYSTFYFRDILIFTQDHLGLFWPSMTFLFVKLLLPLVLVNFLFYYITFVFLHRFISTNVKARWESSGTSEGFLSDESKIFINKKVRTHLSVSISVFYLCIVFLFCCHRSTLRDSFDVLGNLYVIWFVFVSWLAGFSQYRLAILNITRIVPHLSVYSLRNEKVKSLKLNSILFMVALTGACYGSILINNKTLKEAVLDYVYNQRRVARNEISSPELNRHYRKTTSKIMASSLSRAKIPVSFFVPLSEILVNVDRHLVMIQLITVVFSLMVTVILEFQRSQVLKNGIDRVSQTIRQMVLGTASLKGRITITEFDTFGYMTGYINFLLSLLERMVGGVRNLTDNLTAGSNEVEGAAINAMEAMEGLSRSLQKITKEIEVQSTEIEVSREYLAELSKTVTEINNALNTQGVLLSQTSGTAEQFAGSVSEVKKIAHNAEDLTQKLIGIADTGTDAVKLAMESIVRISDASSNMSRAMSVITKIATQTNLLSMNAAIEAAHAGNVGKGFAVVADEIRALSATSTKQSRVVGGEIKTMDERIRQGLSVSSDVQAALNQIIQGIKSSRFTVSQVATSMEKQADGVQDILSSVSLIKDSITQVSNQAESQKQQTDTLRISMQNLLDISGKILVETRMQVENTNEVAQLVSAIANSAKVNLLRVGDLKTAVRKFSL